MCVLRGKGIESHRIIDHGIVFERSANTDDFANNVVQLMNGGSSLNSDECRTVELLISCISLFQWYNTKQTKT